MKTTEMSKMEKNLNNVRKKSKFDKNYKTADLRS